MLTEAASTSAAAEPVWTRANAAHRLFSPLATPAERLVAVMVAAGVLAVLIFAGRLMPAPVGHGTHQQLGLPPCGWLLATGRPCPTCGMTTAFVHAARGELGSAFRTQPFGAFLAVALAGVFWISLTVAVGGARSGAACGKLLSPRILWLVAGLWAASWVYTLATWPGA